MRYGKFFVLSLIILVSLAVWGCSDDPNPTTSLPTDQDYNYEAVQAEVDAMVDAALVQIGEGIQNTAGPATLFNELMKQNGLGDEVVFADNWWVRYNTNLATAFSTFRIDSVQFRKEGVPQQYGTGCDEVLIQHHYNAEYVDTIAEFRNVEEYASLNLEGTNTTEITVNGFRHLEVEARTVTNNAAWRRSLDVVMNVVDVVVLRPLPRVMNSCPNSGSITGTITLLAGRNNENRTETIWEFDLTFDEGTVTGTVASGTYTKTFTRTVCE